MSCLGIFHAKSAYSQNQSFPSSTITGKYVNNDVGIALILPDGYSGNATVINGELSLQASNPTNILSIQMSPKEGSSSAYTMFQAATESPPPKDCTSDKSSPTVSGLTGFSYTVICSNQSYSAFMVDWGNQILMIAMKSSQGSQSAKSDFDAIVNSLTLRQSGPSSIYTSDSLQSIPEQVTLNNSAVAINILSNSKISDFKFDQSHHILSFGVNGTQDSPGRTVIPIGKLLNGPYAVSFDGANYANFFVHKDQATGIASIYLSYHHSAHTISVTGLSVVPEFPTGWAAVVLSAVGIFSLFARTRPSLFYNKS